MESRRDEIRAKLSALSPQQRRILLQEVPAKSRPLELIPRCPPTDVLPQSYSQRRLWYLFKLDPDSSMYNMPQAAVFRGRLDYPGLQGAFNDVLERHSILRAVFSDEGGTPVQKIAPRVKQEIEFIDLTARNATDLESVGGEVIAQIADRPFDLMKGPLAKMTAIKLRDDHHILVINMHHIVSDGWSVMIFVRDFIEYYRARTEKREPVLPVLPIDFSDFVQWQTARLFGAVLDRQVKFWQAKLAGTQPLALPFDRAPTVHTSAHSGSEPITIAPEIRDDLTSVAKKSGCTLFMALLAAFKILLFRYSGQSDINVGVPVAGRTRVETQQLIGYFTNTVLIRTDLAGDPDFLELIGRVRDTSVEAFMHEEVPLEKLADLTEPDRDISRNPLFQVMFILQNTPKTTISIPGVQTELLKSAPSTVKFDMLVEFSERDQGLFGGIGYRTDLFDKTTMTQFSRSFCEIVAAVAAVPDIKISDIPLSSGVQSASGSFSDLLE